MSGLLGKQRGAVNMDVDRADKTQKKRARPIDVEEELPPSPHPAPADVATVRHERHVTWARGLPQAPPQREEEGSSVAVLHNTAESHFELIDILGQHPSLSCLSVDPGRCDGKFIFRGLTPQMWGELRIIIDGLRPVDDEHKVELRAPQRFITGEDLAVRVRTPYVVDPRSFALGLKFKENETRPIAMAPVISNGKVSKCIKMYCASKSHKKKVLKGKTLRWGRMKLSVSSFDNRSSRKTQKRAGRDQN